MKSLVCFMACSMLTLSAWAKVDASTLAGHWRGEFIENVFKKSAGGSPTADNTRTPTEIQFNKDLTGKSIVNNDTANAETWTISGSTYTWNDGTMAVSCTETTRESIAKDPNRKWILEKPEFKNAKTFAAYTYASCKDASGKPCKDTDLPKGLQDSGTWTFVTDSQGKLYHGVFYKYPEGGERTLRWQLSKVSQ